MQWYQKQRRRRTSSVTKHYLANKETSRVLVHSRIEHFNSYYKLTYNRIAIRNQRRCWGSCTSLKNLNFSYRILFLPPELSDYIIVHELCHLAELNHSKNFWALVAETIPDYKNRKRLLRHYEQLPLKQILQKSPTYPHI